MKQKKEFNNKQKEIAKMEILKETVIEAWRRKQEKQEEKDKIFS